MKIKEDGGRRLPDIRPWIHQKYVEVNYYVTPLLSDHGYFRKYLHKISKTASPYCFCKEEEVFDDAEDTDFELFRWQSYPPLLASKIGTTMAANIVGIMISSSENGTQ